MKVFQSSVCLVPRPHISEVAKFKWTPWNRGFLCASDLRNIAFLPLLYNIDSSASTSKNPRIVLITLVVNFIFWKEGIGSIHHCHDIAAAKPPNFVRGLLTTWEKGIREKKNLVPKVADGGKCVAFDLNFKFNCTIKQINE